MIVRGAFLLLAMFACAPAAARETPVTCVNPVSGASWQIRIDYDKHRVDTYEARISATEIFWKDAGGDNYTLNRRSGELTQVTPSSTGGYFLHDRCKLG